jgi:hypothetical protein
MGISKRCGVDDDDGDEVFDDVEEVVDQAFCEPVSFGTEEVVVVAGV